MIIFSIDIQALLQSKFDTEKYRNVRFLYSEIWNHLYVLSNYLRHERLLWWINLTIRLIDYKLLQDRHFEAECFKSLSFSTDRKIVNRRIQICLTLFWLGFAFGGITIEGSIQHCIWNLSFRCTLLWFGCTLPRRSWHLIHVEKISRRIVKGFGLFK